VPHAEEEPKSKGSPVPSSTKVHPAELVATIFITGAAALTIEILGTRIIGPVFGVSLFVWSALLTVTLAALAMGYFAGGVLADRRPSPRLLGAVVAAAGLLLGLVRAYGGSLLRLVEPLGPRAGALVAAILLFAPCMVALGMICPIAVRLATQDLRAAGRTAGSIYAISTAGSLVGAIATGFLLIPSFDTDQILIGTAIVLVLIGSASLAWRGRRAALLLVLFPWVASAMPRAPLPAGVVILDRAQSVYGRVEAIEDHNRGVRLLRADHSIIGAQFTGDSSAAFSFVHVLEAARFLRPAMKDMLAIGLGIGSLPSFLEKEGIRADVVEIDPAVVQFARRHFGFDPRGDVYVEDARTYLARTERRYDLIVHDTFTGGSTPEHLLSIEVIRRVRDLLRPGGVLVLNFVGYSAGPNAEGSHAVARTIAAVFATVRAFRDGPPNEDAGEPGNVIFFASDGPIELTIPAGARFENDVCERVQRGFQQWPILARVPDGELITDTHNPLARLELPAADAHFRAMRGLYPVEVWLN
jgi:spermidine synthase